MAITVFGEDPTPTPTPNEGDPTEVWVPTGAGSTPTASNPSGSTYTNSKSVPPGQPASVWMPNYDRRYQGVPSRTADAGGGYIGNLNNPMANRFFNDLSQSEALSEWDKPTGYLTLALKEELDKMAKEMGNSSSTGKGLWTRAVTNSYNASKEGRRMSPFEGIQNIVNNYYSDPNNTKGKGSDGAGSGSYSGPVITNTISTMDERDVEVTLNSLAIDMLGRNLTEQELKKYSKKFQKEDLQAQTNIRTPNGQAELTSVTKEKPTRETMAMDIVRSNDDYATNTINTDVMDIMAKRLGL